MLFVAASSSTAAAQTQDCRVITDPTAQLSCYNNETPPAQAAKRQRSAPPPQKSKVDSEKFSDKYAEPPDAEDAVVRARINGICRGC
ncbi:hypothetical protein [Bradyrhizobium liaoningense]|uniref:hypothetical protein n=1 Tax=Bradyrhizobium liaoningense TaxID=43992 RepID=UPI001BAB648A|nr:hypothetical protein [Bradyrhizobium liaoningense]MBR0715517.1 hypothetical protein [Bradyrhizobium liaoningense]